MNPKKDLDTIYSWYIRLKNADEDGYCECISCHKTFHWTEIQNGHYISRNYLTTRFLDKNCHPQCIHCNIFLKGNMDEYALSLTKKYGSKVLNELNKLKHESIKLYKKDYIDLIIKYSKQILKIVKKKNLYFDKTKLSRKLAPYKLEL